MRNQILYLIGISAGALILNLLQSERFLWAIVTFFSGFILFYCMCEATKPKFVQLEKVKGQWD